jgi:hypothetical protein
MVFPAKARLLSRKGTHPVEVSIAVTALTGSQLPPGFCGTCRFQAGRV